MSDQDDTSIRIGVETWRELKDMKHRPNQSFDDVIQDLIQVFRESEDMVEELEKLREELEVSEGNPNPMTVMA